MKGWCGAVWILAWGLPAAVRDLRVRSVKRRYLAAGALGALVCGAADRLAAVPPGGAYLPSVPLALACGAVPGLAAALLGRATGGALGPADAWFLVSAGLCLGAGGALFAAAAAFLAAGLAAALLIALGRAGRRTKMPFLPFLYAGTAVWVFVRLP